MIIKKLPNDLLINHDLLRNFMLDKKKPLRERLFLYVVTLKIIFNVYKVPTAFNSSNACTRRLTILASPARCHTLGS